MDSMPPDKGSDLRGMIGCWDDLWHGIYPTEPGGHPLGFDSGRTRRQFRDEGVQAAPAYTRSFSRLVSGLFQRQTPGYVEPPSDDVPLDPDQLSELLAEITSKGAGYGQVLIRPVYDGATWQPAVISPSRYAVEWVHRRAVKVTAWDYAQDPRNPDDDKVGLALVEMWEIGDDAPGTVTTSVYETAVEPGGEGVKLGRQINTDSPPPALAEHPFIVSAGNDDVPRDVFVFVWAWEESGPVPLWYGNEGLIRGLARLWDQEQDDAEMTRKRVAMPKDLLGTSQVLADGGTTVLARPGFNKRDNILLLGSSMSAEHGPNGGVTPIEFDDDLIQRDRIERRENALLELVGINPASIGRNVGGRSDSASAKRADNQMTMNTITAPARNVERCLSDVATELARLASPLAATEWQVSVHEGLKENPIESAENADRLRNAEAASTRTLVATAHPTWSTEEVDAEVDLMQNEGAAESPFE